MLDEHRVRKAARAVVDEMLGTHPKDDELLVSSGRIDSLSVLKLIARLEAQLGVRMPVSQLQPEDFDSIDHIVDTVQRTCPSL